MPIVQQHTVLKPYYAKNALFERKKPRSFILGATETDVIFPEILGITGP